MHTQGEKIIPNYARETEVVSPGFIARVRDLSIMLATRATQDLNLKHGISGDLCFISISVSDLKNPNLNDVEEIGESKASINARIISKFAELTALESELFKYLNKADSQPSIFKQIDKTLNLFYRILNSIGKCEFNIRLEQGRNILTRDIILFETNLDILKLKLQIWDIRLEDIFINGQTEQFNILLDLKKSLRDPNIKFDNR